MNLLAQQCHVRQYRFPILWAKADKILHRFRKLWIVFKDRCNLLRFLTWIERQFISDRRSIPDLPKRDSERDSDLIKLTAFHFTNLIIQDTPKRRIWYAGAARQLNLIDALSIHFLSQKCSEWGWLERCHGSFFPLS